jgi:hypothetical protein
MQALSSRDFLDLWERGFSLHPLDQGLLALGAALPGASYEGLANWPLGVRNRALVALRCSCFGPRLHAWTSCARCGEKLAFEMDDKVWVEEQVAGDPRPSEPIVVKGHSFRLPTTRDLARAAGEADLGLAIRRLLENCRVDTADSPASSVEDLSEEDLHLIGERMVSADPLAETRLMLLCPECGHQWEELFDIVTFFWAEIEARAKRLLFELHTLASAYGWTEKEILSLSEPRRALYLEMAQA